jgi:hypothetical protein
LPSAKDDPDASNVIRVRNASRLPQVVVFRKLFEDCFVSNPLDESIKLDS